MISKKEWGDGPTLFFAHCAKGFIKSSIGDILFTATLYTCTSVYFSHYHKILS